jgi:cyclase
VNGTLLGRPARYEGGLHEAASGILAWLQPNGDWGESNAAVIVGSDEALLVDTLWTPALTRQMLAAIATRVPVPIRTLVNSHSDGDHVWGNELLAGASILATEVAAEIIREEPPAAMQRLRSLAPALGRLPVVGTLGRYVAWMLGPYDFAGIELTPPTRTFAGTLTLTVGGREVVLEQVGPAHTPGDLIVHVPDARCVIAADVMFVGVHPVMWAGPTASWIAALDRILALDPAVVVPGHGPLAGAAEVRTLRDYFDWLGRTAPARLEDGAAVPALAAELASSAEFRAAPWGGWIGPERLVITVATIDRHRRGVAGRVGSRERARLFGQVAAVARELG